MAFGKKSFGQKSGRFRKLKYWTAALLLLGTPAAYRLGTEETVEDAKVTALDPPNQDRNYWRIITDKGSYKNENSPIGPKFNFASADIQRDIKKGKIYRIRSYGGILRDILPGVFPEANILSVKATGGTEEVDLPPPVSAVPVPAAVEKPPASVDIEFARQTETPPPAITGARRIDDGKEAGFALNENETSFFKTLFGEGFHTEDLRTHFYKEERLPTVAVAVSQTMQDMQTGEKTLVSQHINIYGRKYCSHDFTQDEFVVVTSFSHEMLHIWQNQTFKKYTYAGNGGVYDYQLSANSRFVDFGKEQQATIFEDYVGRFLHRDHLAPNDNKASRRFRNYAENPVQGDANLKRIVEEQFPGAFNLRKTVEVQQKPASQSKISAPKQG